MARGPVSLQLHKLSFCTTATLHAKMLWEHLSGDIDMFAVFDHVKKPGLGQSVSEKQIVRLIRHGNLLEEIDLENIVYQVRLDEERFRSQQIQDSDRFVVLVIKHPSVALRYQLASGEVRRIQMNFRPELGYEMAVQIFRALGVPIQNKNISESFKYGGSGGLSPEQHSQAMPSYVAAAEGIRTRTGTYSSHSTTYHNSLTNLGTVPNLERPSSALSSYRGISSSPTREHLEARGGFYYSPTVAEVQRPLQAPNSIERPTTSFGHSLPSSSAPEKTLNRPATAPITLSQLMPPRRELPFPPGPTTSITDRTAHTEDPSGREKAESKDPKKAATTTRSRAKGNVKGKPSRPSSSRAKPKPLANEDLPKDQPALEKSNLQLKPQKSTTAESQLPPSSSSKLSGSKSVMTTTSPSKINTRSKSSATAEKPIPVPLQFSKDFENIPPDEYMDRLDHWVRKYQHLPAPEPMVKPMGTKNDQLAAWAAQTEDKRKEAIDDMLCACLDDENFKKLVEDVHGSWRRVGLGF